MLNVDLVRMGMCLVFAFSAGVSSIRALHRRSVLRGQLVALTLANVALFLGQLTLFGTPFTVRTVFAAVVAVADVGWLVALFWNGPPTDPRV